MLSILNTLTLQKKLQKFVTNTVFFDKKVKTQQQQNKLSNIKNLCRNRGLNSGPLAPKANVSPLHHSVNCE